MTPASLKYPNGGEPGRPSRQGPIAWMVRNRVAANTLAIILLLGGLLMIGTIRQEVFPEIEPQVVSISVAYPGASPEEVEQGVVLAIEEKLRGIDAVERVNASAREGHAQIIADLFLRADRDRAFNDIRAAVERITTFPDDVESPVIILPDPRIEVLSLIIYGDFDRRTLQDLAELARSELLRDGRVTTIDIGGFPPPEISIEVSQEQLRQYKLTIPQIAQIIAQASIDLPGGEIRAPGGDVFVRTTEERRTGIEFRDIIVRGLPDGTKVRVGDICNVRDGFRETGPEAYFGEWPAARLRLIRIGEQSPLEIASAGRKLVRQWQKEMPDTVGIMVWNDYSIFFRDRVGLLIEKGLMGLGLVLLILGAFLHPRLAFWVSLGIAIAFLGGFLLMPGLGVTINMMSLFAFILVLGIVVDDAIVVGEAAHQQCRNGLEPVDAAIAGAREVVVPVTFAVCTTLVVFVPMLFIPGIMGDFFRSIPFIVIPILLISLLQAFFVLPAQLSSSKGLLDQPERNRMFRRIQTGQAWLAQRLDVFIEKHYTPFARKVIRLRYLTLAIGLALVIVPLGFVLGGKVNVILMEDIEGDVVTASFVLPFGTPVEQTRKSIQMLAEKADRVLDELGGKERYGLGIYSEIGTLDPAQEEDLVRDVELIQEGEHIGAVSVLLVESDKRPFSSAEFSDYWRKAFELPAGVQRLRFEHRIGPASGAHVAFRLMHDDWDTARAAAEKLASHLHAFPGVIDVDDGLQYGKQQVSLKLKPQARNRGITEQDLAMQIRGAFFGAEAVRHQRGRHELRVYVRLPLAERRSQYSLETFLIRTPEGGEIPLAQAAFLHRERSDTGIHRQDGERTLFVSADIDFEVITPDRMTRVFERDIMPVLQQEFRGLEYEVAGQQEDLREAMEVLILGFAIAAMVIYALMAIVFRSYLQPVLIVGAIPFGFSAAILGHILMGYDLSMVSMFGIVALGGVVINDSLVLVYLINTLRRSGMDLVDSVLTGVRRRFRPVLLTSITAFLGLAPMIFETSIQARVLIPMAISLGFGVLFVTPIALILLPAMIVIGEDILEAWPPGCTDVKRRIQ